MLTRLWRAARHRLGPRLLRSWLRPTGGDTLVRLGTSYGGWWVPSDLIGPKVVAYCAGAGEDISFDLELVALGCVVTTFDPTPRAIEFVEAHAPERTNFRFVPVGWWHESDVVRFYAPREKSHVSHSVVNLQGTQDYFEARVAAVSTLMKELGDDRVDLIKMDIEGAEFAVIDSLLEVGPLPTVLCVEFDQPTTLRSISSSVRRLQSADYRLVHIEGWNFTLVRPPGRSSF